MTDYLLILLFVFAVIDWIAVARGLRLLDYIFKPVVILILIIWVWLVSGFQGQILWFGLGLVFSLAGDIILLLPGDKFRAGLIAFLLAHISYIIGFNDTVPPIELASLVLLIFVLLPVRQIYLRIANGLSSSGNDAIIPYVLVYSFVISIMLYSALLTLVRPDWIFSSAILASFGALLFSLSDTLLAWNKFVSPLSYPRLRVMIPYHIGQFMIVIGAVIHFS